MIKMVINCNEAWELKDEVKNLKKYGYKKIGDAYWTQVWTKGNNTVVLNRNF